MKNRLTADKILDQFSKNELTKIVGEPTLDGIQKLEEEAQENASMVDASLGGGNHGHFGMAMATDECLALAGTPFAKPQNPGHQQVFGPAINVAPLQEGTTNQWEEDWCHCDTFKNIQKAL